jgi:DNA-binding GntR family transcriptional regulator
MPATPPSPRARSRRQSGPYAIQEDRRQPSSASRTVSRHALRQRLLELILSGKQPPGSKLVQLQLAKKFKTSLGSIREALLELQMYGVVETDDNRGIFVRQLDGKGLLDLIDVRELFEGQAARACAMRVAAEGPEILDGLSNLVDEMTAASAAKQYSHSAATDRRFHQQLIELSNNTYLSLLSMQCIELSKIIYTKAPAAHVSRVHRQLVQAIASGDPDRAEQEARRHVRDLRDKVAALLAEGGEGIYWLGT